MTQLPMTQAEASAAEEVRARTQVRVYVAGDGPNSDGAIAALRALLAEFSEHAIDVEIVDVIQEPERAMRDGVLVTPMLVKHAPPPERRILGRLSDRRLLLSVLGLEEPRHA
jgi:circadian clock protein KaiB